MQISSRMTMAVHIMLFLGIVKSQGKITSDFLASSINVNPVVVRRLLQQLKAAELIDVSRGNDGITLKRPLAKVTMLDLYKAVECIDNGVLFHFHENPNQLCPIGKNIHSVLDKRLDKIQKAMESEMASIHLNQLENDLLKLI